MHDTYLNTRLYEAIIKLCNENSISRINNITISVNSDSHITDESLREQFTENNNELIGALTDITIEKKEIGKLNAVIRYIDGE